LLRKVRNNKFGKSTKKNEMEKIENYNIEYFYNGKALDSNLIKNEFKVLENYVSDSFNSGQLSGTYSFNMKSDGNTHSMDIISFQFTKKKLKQAGNTR